MHILVATDGVLDPDQAAEAVERIYREGDSVTVFTAVNVPTDFLRRLGDRGVKEAAAIALEAGQGFTSGDRAAERLAPAHRVQADPPLDSPVLAALRSTAKSRTKPIVKQLAARGISAESDWATTENKTAHTIMQTIQQHGSAILVIGSVGHGRFEGLLGSTGTKLVRHAPCSVLVLRDT